MPGYKEPSPIDRELAAVLKARLAETGMTVPQLARDAQMPLSSTDRKTRGEQVCRVADLVTLAHAMGVPAWRLLKKAEESHGLEGLTSPQSRHEARRCLECGKKLPRDAWHQQKYCDETCKLAARKKRARSKR